MNKIEMKKNIYRMMLAALISAGASELSTTSVQAQEIEGVTIDEVSEDAEEINTTYLINYYSRVFNLNEELVYNYISDATQSFTLMTWEDYNVIKAKSYDSKELSILMTIRDMYYNPEDYGFTKEELKNDVTYEVGLEPEEMVEKYCELFNINKNIALAIVYTECGTQVDSYNYRVNNNPAGLGPHMKFENKEIGIIYFVNLLKESYGCTLESDTEFLKKIAKTYSGNETSHWLSLSLPLYDDVSDDYLTYAPELKETPSVAKAKTKKLEIVRS